MYCFCSSANNYASFLLLIAVVVQLTEPLRAEGDA